MFACFNPSGLYHRFLKNPLPKSLTTGFSKILAPRPVAIQNIPAKFYSQFSQISVSQAKSAVAIKLTFEELGLEFY